MKKLLDIFQNSSETMALASLNGGAKASLSSFTRTLLFILLLSIGGTTVLFAEKISSYHTIVTVQQSGELQVVEKIKYDFQTASKHGIFRDIPYTVRDGGLPRDLGFGNFSVTMDGKSVQWEKQTLSQTDSGEMIRLKIGSAQHTITGLHSYEIRYQVQKGVLRSSLGSTYDAIRWNMIGTGWEIPIENIKCDIYLPASLSQQNTNIKRFTGRYGEQRSDGTIIWQNSDHLQYSLPSLSLHEGVTIEVNYPQGSLGLTAEQVMAHTTTEKFLTGWHWPAFIGFLLYLWLYLLKHTGISDKRSIAVQYSLPKDMQVLQAGLIYDKFADDDDFTAAILELAQQGYLTIYQKKESDHPVLNRSKKSTEKLSDEYKYLMDNLLFHNKNNYKLKQNSSTEASRMQKGFDTINEMLYQWSVREGYMSENPQSVRKKFLIISILLLVPIFIFAIYSSFLMYGIEMVIMPLFASIFMGVGLSVFLQKGVFSKIFGFVFAGFGAMPLLFIASEHYSWKDLLLSPLMVVLLLSVAIYLFYRKLGSYTARGSSAYKHLLGLEQFMSRVKSDEVKRRLSDDPLYLEKTLPYAVLFGITEHWLELFDELNIAHPIWYSGSLHNISSLSSSMHSASTPPPSSSGGSSGGGGFSGGGGGGGGGGSW